MYNYTKINYTIREDGRHLKIIFYLIKLKLLDPIYKNNKYLLFYVSGTP